MCVTAFNIITLVISFLALIIAGIAMFYTRKQANEIAKQNALISEQNRVSLKPELWLNGIMQKPYEKELHIDLNNSGEAAHLTHIAVLSNNLQQHSIPFPYKLNKDDQMWIYFNYVGSKDVQSDLFEIELYFKDKADNEYNANIVIDKGRYRIEKVTYISKTK